MRIMLNCFFRADRQEPFKQYRRYLGPDPTKRHPINIEKDGWMMNFSGPHGQAAPW
jgi:hypothetical protein